MFLRKALLFLLTILIILTSLPAAAFADRLSDAVLEFNSVLSRIVQIDSEIAQGDARVRQITLELQANSSNISPEAIQKSIALTNETLSLMNRKNTLLSEKESLQARVRSLDAEIQNLKQQPQPSYNPNPQPGYQQPTQNPQPEYNHEQPPQHQSVQTLAANFGFGYGVGKGIGEPIELNIRILNEGTVPWTFYGAVTVRKPDGSEIDLEKQAVHIQPGEMAPEIFWQYVPDQSGTYGVVFGVWKDLGTPLTHSGWVNDAFSVHGGITVQQLDRQQPQLTQPTDERKSDFSISILDGWWAPSVRTGGNFDVRSKFWNNGSSPQLFIVALTIRSERGLQTDLEKQWVYLNPGEETVVWWNDPVPTDIEPGLYDLIFGVWKEKDVPYSNGEWHLDAITVTGGTQKSDDASGRDASIVSGENMSYPKLEDNVCGPDRRHIVVTEGSAEFSIVDGNHTAYRNFPVAPFRQNGVLYVPLRKLVESLGGIVDWIGYPIASLNGNLINFNGVNIIYSSGNAMINVEALAGYMGIDVEELDPVDGTLACALSEQRESEPETMEDDDPYWPSDTGLETTYDNTDAFLINLDLALMSMPQDGPYGEGLTSSIFLTRRAGLWIAKVYESNKILRFGVKYGPKVFAISDDVFSQYLKLANTVKVTKIPVLQKGFRFQKEVMEKIGLHNLKGIETTIKGVGRLDGVIGKTTEFAGKTMRAGDILETKAWVTQTLLKSMKSEKGIIWQLRKYVKILEPGNKVKLIFKDELPVWVIDKLKMALKDEMILDKVEILNGVW